MRPSETPEVFLGWSAQEMRAYVVAETSLQARCGHAASVRRLCRLMLLNWYTRATETRDGRLWDVLSGAPMSTDHAIARFFVPFLMRYQGWALFADSDILVRDDVRALFALADPKYAVMVVRHAPLLEEGTKKDGAAQQAYPRKNWSSVMLWNCGHPSNHALTPDVLNAWPGRDLHAFRWLRDEEIGELPARWNALVGVQPLPENPAIVHYTLGTPDLPDHERDPYADEWYAVARVAGYGLSMEAVTA